jgi:hypothetical protein
MASIRVAVVDAVPSEPQGTCHEAFRHEAAAA